MARGDQVGPSRPKRKRTANILLSKQELQEYLDEDHTPSMIAKKCNVSTVDIQEKIRKYGIKKTKVKKTATKPSPATSPRNRAASPKTRTASPWKQTSSPRGRVVSSRAQTRGRRGLVASLRGRTIHSKVQVVVRQPRQRRDGQSSQKEAETSEEGDSGIERCQEEDPDLNSILVQVIRDNPDNDTDHIHAIIKSMGFDFDRAFVEEHTRKLMGKREESDPGASSRQEENPELSEKPKKLTKPRKSKKSTTPNQKCKKVVTLSAAAVDVADSSESGVGEKDEDGSSQMAPVEGDDTNKTREGEEERTLGDGSQQSSKEEGNRVEKKKDVGKVNSSQKEIDNNEGKGSETGKYSPKEEGSETANDKSVKSLEKNDVTGPEPSKEDEGKTSEAEGKPLTPSRSRRQNRKRPRRYGNMEDQEPPSKKVMEGEEGAAKESIEKPPIQSGEEKSGGEEEGEEADKQLKENPDQSDMEEALAEEDGSDEEFNEKPKPKKKRGRKRKQLYNEMGELVITKKGRPRLQLSSENLKHCMDSGLPLGKIAEVFGTCKRSITRYLELNKMRKRDRFCNIPDKELDEMIAKICAEHTDWGQLAIQQHLQSKGMIFRRCQIRNSVRRVDPIGIELRKLNNLKRRWNRGSVKTLDKILPADGINMTSTASFLHNPPRTGLNGLNEEDSVRLLKEIVYTSKRQYVEYQKRGTEGDGGPDDLVIVAPVKNEPGAVSKGDPGEEESEVVSQDSEGGEVGPEKENTPNEGNCVQGAGEKDMSSTTQNEEAETPMSAADSYWKEKLNSMVMSNKRSGREAAAQRRGPAVHIPYEELEQCVLMGYSSTRIADRFETSKNNVRRYLDSYKLGKASRFEKLSDEALDELVLGVMRQYNILKGREVYDKIKEKGLQIRKEDIRRSLCRLHPKGLHRGSLDILQGGKPTQCKSEPRTVDAAYIMSHLSKEEDGEVIVMDTEELAKLMSAAEGNIVLVDEQGRQVTTYESNAGQEQGPKEVKEAMEMIVCNEGTYIVSEDGAPITIDNATSSNTNNGYVAATPNVSVAVVSSGDVPSSMPVSNQSFNSGADVSNTAGGTFINPACKPLSSDRFEYTCPNVPQSAQQGGVSRLGERPADTVAAPYPQQNSHHSTAEVARMQNDPVASQTGEEMAMQLCSGQSGVQSCYTPGIGDLLVVSTTDGTPGTQATSSVANTARNSMAPSGGYSMSHNQVISSSDNRVGHPSQMQPQDFHHPQVPPNQVTGNRSDLPHNSHPSQSLPHVSHPPQPPNEQHLQPHHSQTQHSSCSAQGANKIPGGKDIVRKPTEEEKQISAIILEFNVPEGQLPEPGSEHQQAPGLQGSPSPSKPDGDQEEQLYIVESGRNPEEQIQGGVLVEEPSTDGGRDTNKGAEHIIMQLIDDSSAAMPSEAPGGGDTQLTSLNTVQASELSAQVLQELDRIAQNLQAKEGKPAPNVIVVTEDPGGDNVPLVSQEKTGGTMHS